MVQRILLGTFVCLLLIAAALFTLSRYQTVSPTNEAMPPKPLPKAALLEPSRPQAKAMAVAGPIEDNAGRTVNSGDLAKIQTLKEILKSKNDNDPRLDKDFQSLSENAKRLMRNEYHSYRPERFNEKGTIVYLLGKNLTSPQDFDFLAEVLTEPPCENIEDCSKPPSPVNSEFADEEALNDVTTSYPQIVSLKNLEGFLARDDVSPTLKDLALRDLRLAEGSRNARISKMAQNIEERLARAGGSGF